MSNITHAGETNSIAQLPVLQRRLRHLHSISARNVNIPAKHCNPDVSVIQLYFTLHTDFDNKAFYKSETIKGSLNPMWKSLSLVHLDSCTEVDLTRRCVWYSYFGTENKLFVTWDVHFDGLVCLENQTAGDSVLNAPNTLIFGIHDNLYGAALESNVNVPMELPAIFDVDTSSVRNSYNLRSLQRVQTVLHAIHQTQSTVKRVRQSIDSCLGSQLYIDRKRAQREFAVLKVNLIRGDLQWRAGRLRLRKDAFESQQLNNFQKEVLLKNKWSKLTKDSEELREMKKHYFDVRDELIKTGAQLVLRRKQLLSEIALIYPIVQQPNMEYRICGVRLPNSEDFDGQDETMLSVALGYVCHLVAMISNYLDIPLRYLMDHHGSRSTITDRIIDKLADNERQFPLYGKGKEKFQFHYGVYILNKNIAQLRHYCGMPTADLRCTLENISSLLCDRLGVTVNRNDAFSNEHSLVPPSFGGAHISSSRLSDAVSLSSNQQQLMADSSPSLSKIREETSHRDAVTINVGLRNGTDPVDRVSDSPDRRIDADSLARHSGNPDGSDVVVGVDAPLPREASCNDSIDKCPTPSSTPGTCGGVPSSTPDTCGGVTSSTLGTCGGVPSSTPGTCGGVSSTYERDVTRDGDSSAVVTGIPILMKNCESVANSPSAKEHQIKAVGNLEEDSTGTHLSEVANSVEVSSSTAAVSDSVLGDVPSKTLGPPEADDLSRGKLTLDSDGKGDKMVCHGWNTFKTHVMVPQEVALECSSDGGFEDGFGAVADGCS